MYLHFRTDLAASPLPSTHLTGTTMSDKKHPSGRLFVHKETNWIGRTIPEVINPVKQTVIYGYDSDGLPIQSIANIDSWGPVKYLVDPDKLKYIGFID